MFFIGVIGVFALHYLPEKYALKEGQISPSTIKSPMTITYEDIKKTEERKKLVEQSIEEIYTLDKNVVPEIESIITSYFRDFSWQLAKDLKTADKIRNLQIIFELSEKSAKSLLYIEPELVTELREKAIELIQVYWRNGVREIELQEKKSELYAAIDELEYKDAQKELLKTIYNKLDLRANFVVDEDATNKALLEAVKNEGPVITTVLKGQKIIGEGEVVTPEHIEILKAIGYQRSSASPYLSLLGITIFLAVVSFLTILFLKLYRRDVYNNSKHLMLLSLIIFSNLLIAKLITIINISSNPDISDLIGYLVPVAAGSMLVTILLETKVALFFTMVLSILIGILTGNHMTFASTYFVGGLVGVYSVSRFSQRFDWVKAGVFISITNVLCVTSWGLINNLDWKPFVFSVVLAVINGFLSVVFAYGTLPFLESGFKLTTSVRLLELSNPNHPLLKRLLMEASGTYHHSILVGNLGEAAADAVGADSLLVRIGSYYHDIGKLKRPYFFIENQLGTENPHEKLTPSLSTLIITSHVKDGVELAKEYKLPGVIIDLIEQHHGTSLVSYFYHKAQELGNADSIKDKDFRYEATKPQSKEAAIIMLADSVEAAVRSMKVFTEGKIEGLVRKIIKDRLQDGQLDESALTFKDLDKIAQSFIHILYGIFHSRIEYPETVLSKMEGGLLPDGNTDRGSTGPDTIDGGTEKNS